MGQGGTLKTAGAETGGEPEGGGGRGGHWSQGWGASKRDSGLSLHFDSMETLSQTRNSFPFHLPVPATDLLPLCDAYSCPCVFPEGVYEAGI